MSTSKFSASDAAIGYLYQVRVALLWSLRRLKDGTDFVVSLETLDDVTFETSDGTPDELLQTKHHRSRQASLADSSPDLWKSLRVWFEGHASQSIPVGTTLYLLSTSAASPGSVAAYLRAGKTRDVEAALQALQSAAQSSSNTTNAPSYEVFLRASPPTRRTIIESVVVIDAAPDIGDLDQLLQAEIFWAVDRKYHEAFLDRVEGWWLRRTLKQLTQGDRILADEIEAEMSDLREQFKQESLPIDDDLLRFTLDEGTRSEHADSIFVRQIELIKANQVRIFAAIRDYYRAFEQRSRWLRDDLLLVGDLDQYERKLTEEWELVFAAMKDKLAADVTEEARQRAAREVLQWAEQAIIPIRPEVSEPFVARGSLHMLADDLRVGWHPEFRERLSSLLGIERTTA